MFVTQSARTWLGCFIVLLMCLTTDTSSAVATENNTAGVVVRMQGTSVAMQNAMPRRLMVGDEIQRGDVISTGRGARLEVRMFDDAILTLGERTVFVIVDYTVGGQQDNALLRLMQGAFKAVSGDIVANHSGPFVVETERATIGIRGTTVWGGVLDGDFEVAMLDGKGIYVETRAGRVELSTVGQGTKITSADQPPSKPVIWKQKKTDRAIATVSFDKL